jgi:gamma-glutamylputrescine oxidase
MPSAPPPPATYYHASSLEPPAAAAALAGSVTTPVCIVGGGLAGLATALSLAERGIAAVLLEAGEVGDGASGRNGGMVSAGFARGSLELARRFGHDRARRLHALSQAAMRQLRGRVERHAIACRLVDGVVVASWQGGAGGLKDEILALNRDFGMRLAFWPRRRVRGLYRTLRYRDAAFDPDGFHLDPLALVRGHARAAVGLGARLFEHSPATSLARHGSAWRIGTPSGEIVAGTVVLCTSAYGDPLLPALRRAILPVATYVIVTEPLGPRLAEVVGAPYAVHDDRFATGYYRPLEGGRLLWGGRVSLRERSRNLMRLMRHDLARVYPQLADVRIDHAWSGRMGFARHKMPLVRELEPGLWVNSAYGGHGLDGTTMGGELVAAAIAGGGRDHTLLLPFRPGPAFGGLGRLAAQAIYWGHVAGDELRGIRAQRRQRPDSPDAAD